MNTKMIELNGKQYDAITGRLLSDTPVQPAQTKNKTSDNDNFKALIDIATPRGSIRRTVTPTMHATHTKNAHAQTKALDIHRAAPHNLLAHQPQRAKTLMRQAVTHPNASFKRQAKAVTHTGALIKNPQITVLPKQSAAIVDTRRQQRAQKIHPSKLVRHFKEPARDARPQAISSPVRIATAHPPAATAARMRAMQPVAVRAKPVIAAPSPRQASADIFERALAQATSHKQPAYPAKRSAKKSNRIRMIFSVLALGIAAFAIVGFVAYQNLTTIQLRLASSHAGIHATLPAWRPNGFSVASLSAVPGSVTVHFRNAQASQDFSIVQAASKWNSGTLLNNYVLPSTNASYETIQAGSSTIYTYGNNNATWVTRGMWYRLTTNGVLSTSQIVQLVANM